MGEPRMSFGRFVLKMPCSRRRAGQAWVYTSRNRFLHLEHADARRRHSSLICFYWEISVKVHEDDVHVAGSSAKANNEFAVILCEHPKLKCEGPFFFVMRYSHSGRTRIVFVSGVLFIKLDEKILNKAIALMGL